MTMTLWPLWVSLFLIGIMGLLPIFSATWRVDPWGGLSAAAAIITAGAAISIPMIIDNNARATRTLDQLNDLDRKIVEALTVKQRKDRINNRTYIDMYDPAYIKSDPEIQESVYCILNDYEYICLGANNGLFINDVIKYLRWDALASTWVDYRPFITSHRR
jgi:hypothetical protein